MDGVMKADSKLGISLERASAQVPDDGRYHVVVDGEIVFSSRVEVAAVAEYEEVRDARRGPARERQRREQAVADLRAHRASSWSAKQTRDAKKGGRGVGR
ncbi:hypothetical protein GCM10027300_19390 [Modestobacter lapidis]